MVSFPKEKEENNQQKGNQHDWAKTPAIIFNQKKMYTIGMLTGSWIIQKVYSSLTT